MSQYTVQQLAAIANISTRTLRHYDTINLLKPAAVGDNGYRYYGKKELLQLQQILLFKEAGLSLKSIISIIKKSEFSQISALQSHKHHIRQEIGRLKQLLTTIDETTQHLVDDMPLDDFRLYLGLKHPNQHDLEKKLIEAIGPSAQIIINKQIELSRKLTKEDYKQSIKETEDLCQAFAKLINDNIHPESDQAQALTESFYKARIQGVATHVPKEDWMKFLKFEMQDPSRKDWWEAVHPLFAEYFLQSFEAYCEKLPA